MLRGELPGDYGSQWSDVPMPYVIGMKPPTPIIDITNLVLDAHRTAQHARPRMHPHHGVNVDLPAAGVLKADETRTVAIVVHGGGKHQWNLPIHLLQRLSGRPELFQRLVEHQSGQRLLCRRNGQRLADAHPAGLCM